MRFLSAAWVLASLFSSAAVADAGRLKHDVILRAALEDIASEGQSKLLTPGAARQMRREMDLYLGDTLKKLGAMTALYGMGSADPAPPLVYRGKKQKLAQYQATYEHGWIQWRAFVRPDGKIGRLIPFSVNAPGTD